MNADPIGKRDHRGRIRAVRDHGPPAGVQLGASWRPIDLSGALRGSSEVYPPSMLARTDGKNLIYAGKNHAIVGDGEAGKGWLALSACVERLMDGEGAAYVDLEDDERTVVARLRALGALPERIAAQFLYFRPEEPLTTEAWSTFSAELDPAPALVVFDSVNACMALHGLDPNVPGDIADWQSIGPRRAIAETGAAVIQIDHVVKNVEQRGKSPFGGVAKRNLVDVQYQLEVVEPFARGLDGAGLLREGKDRPGWVKGELGLDDGRSKTLGHVVGVVKFRSLPGGAVRVEVEPPGPSARSRDFRPTRLMEAVSRAVEDAPGMSQRDIRVLVTGKNEYVLQALERLVERGYVSRERSGKAFSHKSVKPYRASDDSEGAHG